MMLLTSALMISAELSISPIPETSPMIFNRLATAQTAYESYRMIYYVNLTDFYHLKDLSAEAIKLAESTCSLLEEDQCKVSIAQIKSQYITALRADKQIRSQRKSRALCEWCGSLQHHLFGTMDAKRAREYAAHINKVANETEIQHNLVANQTSLFQAFLRMNNQSVNKVEKELNKMQTEIVDLTNAYNILRRQQLTSKTLGLVQIATSMLNEHVYLFNQIDRSISDVKNHRIPEFIPLQQLINDLKTVAATLKPNQRLPVDMMAENPLHVFKYADITSILVDEMLITEILIPVAEREQFWLYKVTPIPIDTENGRLIAKIPNTYFLINMDQTKYIPLSKEELNRGKMLSHDEILYTPTASIQLKYENVCAWKLLLESSLEAALTACNFVPLIKNDVILTIIDNESYFASMMSETKIWEICDAQQASQREVSGRFIINLNPGCSVKTTSYIIKPHKVHTRNNTQIISPKMVVTQSTINELRELAKLKTSNLNFTRHQSIYIHNEEEMQHFIQQSDAIVNAARHDYRLDQLKYNTANILDSPWVIALILITIISISIIFLIVLSKFNAFSLILSFFNIGRQTESFIANLEDKNEYNSKKYKKTPKNHRKPPNHQSHESNDSDY